MVLMVYMKTEEGKEMWHSEHVLSHVSTEMAHKPSHLENKGSMFCRCSMCYLMFSRFFP